MPWGSIKRSSFQQNNRGGPLDWFLYYLAGSHKPVTGLFIFKLFFPILKFFVHYTEFCLISNNPRLVSVSVSIFESDLVSLGWIR